MSSKKTEFFEPVKLDTTLLKIEIKADGDLKTKEYDLIPFHPNMADMKDLSNNSYILFPSFVKITLKDLQNSTAGQNYKKVFTSLDKFINLIKYVTKPDKEDDATLLVNEKQFVQDFTLDDSLSDFRPVQKSEPLTSDEIITNNIGLIKSLFFPVNGLFFILGHEYVIAKSRYIPPYSASSDINQSINKATKRNIPLNYEIKIQLELLDATNNPNIGNFSRLNCKAKKNSITNDIHDIFGTPLGLPEQPKAVLPTLILPTTASQRGFGKIQLDWENRNKYVKPPSTEAERQAQEKGKSELQKKMDKYEKKQQDYDKIPPMWIKETKALENSYKAFEKEINAYQKEYAELIKNNIAYKDDVETKINNAIKRLVESVPELEPQAEAEAAEKEKEKEKKKKELFEKIIKEVSNNNYKVLDDPFIKSLLEAAKQAINMKYLEPFLDELREKKKDVDALQTEVDNLTKQLNKLNDEPNKFGASSKKQEVITAQNKLIKVKVPYEELLLEIGPKGDKLVTKWLAAIETMDKVAKSIETEKNRSENELIKTSVSKELSLKLDEIKKYKKLLLKANFFEGNSDELTSEEKRDFTKEEPIQETVKEITNTIEELEGEYMEIAAKLGFYNKVQAKIRLLTDDLARFTKMRKTAEDEEKKLNYDIESRNRSIYEITRKYSSTAKMIENDEDLARKDKLEKEQKTLQEKINTLAPKLYENKIKEKVYEDVIKELRKAKPIAISNVAEESNGNLKAMLDENSKEKIKAKFITETEKYFEKMFIEVDRELTLAQSRFDKQNKKNSNNDKKNDEFYSAKQNLKNVTDKTNKKKKNIEENIEKILKIFGQDDVAIQKVIEEIKQKAAAEKAAAEKAAAVAAATPVVVGGRKRRTSLRKNKHGHKHQKHQKRKTTRRKTIRKITRRKTTKRKSLNRKNIIRKYKTVRRVRHKKKKRYTLRRY
jgi:hypothetical protein